MHRPPSLVAFTLIELMIAIALGMLLVYTAVAGFRVASQSVTLANQLSLENALIRAGYSEACRQLDFWTNVDDPDDADRQRLRGTVTLEGYIGNRLQQLELPDPNSVGLPFTPFSGGGLFRPNQPLKIGMSITNSAVPRFPSALGTPQAPIIPLDGSPTTPSNWVDEADSDIGFDPTFAWAPHDPRTWYRGNCIEKHRRGGDGVMPPAWFGRYAIFTNIDEGSSLNLRTWKVEGSPGVKYDATYEATSLPPHRWYGRQLIGLVRALGFYGMCDYLPSNMLYSTYTTWSNSESDAGLAGYFYPLGNGVSFIGNGMNSISALGTFALTVAQSYGVMNPYARTVTDSVLADEHYRYHDSDYTSDDDDNQIKKLRTFMSSTLGAELLLEQSPINWPKVTVGVSRYIKSGKFANLARVRWTSPLTGSIAELSFTGVGTTLRGARMQRKPGGGWAHWDNDGAASSNDNHLDSP